MKSKELNSIMERFGIESENIEFKESIPSNSEKYVKTAIAFANCKGGKIVFGIEDKTLKVIGIDKKNISKYVDSITNAIYDSCESKIIPNVAIQEINNRLLIVVEINAGMQKPYYYKSLGISEGTFIRVSGTTRKAPQYVIQELLLKGSNRSFDQLETNIFVSNQQITKFCNNIYNFIIDKDERKRESIHRITKNQLISWKIIKEKGNRFLATNSFLLLDGNEDLFPESAIQCAVFKGNNRSSLILSKKEFKGPLYQQIEEAYNFVIQHIDIISTIDGLYRNDRFELPPFAIREIIANAVCHRSYLAPGKIQVALYDNRLEVTSPGNLDETLTLERLKSGLSKVRNKAIASIFSYMEIVETWGSGIPRVFDEVNKYNLQEPEFINLEGDVRVNLFRKTIQTNSKTDQSLINTIQTSSQSNSNKPYIETIQTNPKTDQTSINTNQTSSQSNPNKFHIGTNQTDPKTDQTIKKFIIDTKISDKQKKLLEIIYLNNSLSIEKVAEQLCWTVSNVKYHINKLKKLGLLKRVGTIHNGHWEIFLD